MSVLGLLLRRLLERRLLGDGERAASLFPGSLALLALATLFSAIAFQEKGARELLSALMLATAGWSLLRAFLDAEDLRSQAQDRAVIEPLPLPAWKVGLARALVLLVAALVDTLNLALPPCIFAACLRGPGEALAWIALAVLSTLIGLAVGLAGRRAFERLLGRERALEWEGPLRLCVGVALFTLLIAAPELTPPSDSLRARFLPPYAFVAAAGDAAAIRPVACLLALALAAALLVLALRRAPEPGHARGRASRSALAVPRRLVRADERAGFEFMLANLRRDRAFRLRVYPLFAFPFAVVAAMAIRKVDAYTPLMALYGAAVYATLAQRLLAYSEGDGGPRLLASLPLRDASGFRLGAEKAWLAGVLAPVFAVVLLAILLASLVGGGLAGALAAGSSLVLHAATAALAAVVLCGFGFATARELPFSQVDRGIYPADFSGPAFSALLLCTILAVLTRELESAGWAALAPPIVLALGARLLFSWKRRRWTMIAAAARTGRARSGSTGSPEGSR